MAKSKAAGDTYEVLISFVDLVMLKGFNKSSILLLSDEQIKRYGGYVKLKSTPMTELAPSTPVAPPKPEPETSVEDSGNGEQQPAKAKTTRKKK